MAKVERVEFICDFCKNRTDPSMITTMLIEIDGKARRIDVCDSDAAVVIELFRVGMEAKSRAVSWTQHNISEKTGKLLYGEAEVEFAVDAGSTFQFTDAVPQVGMQVSSGSS